MPPHSESTPEEPSRLRSLESRLTSSVSINPPKKQHEPYSTLGVAAVAVALGGVVVLSLMGYQTASVGFLAVLVLSMAVIRVFRPDGTWIAARSRKFDVLWGVALALTLALLTPYAVLPHVL